MNTSQNGAEGFDKQPQATLCQNGCGFFANAGSCGLCSKCFREQEQGRQQADAVAQKAAAAIASAPSQQASVAEPAPSHTSAAAPAVAEVAQSGTSSVEQAPCPCEPSASAAPSAPPPNPNRCNVQTCRKKLGLTGFKCRCGASYCGSHRAPEDHECSFDFKSHGRAKIAEANPLVMAAKIDKI